jgi:hypothetical protein
MSSAGAAGHEMTGRVVRLHFRCHAALRPLVVLRVTEARYKHWHGGARSHRRAAPAMERTHTPTVFQPRPRTMVVIWSTVVSFPLKWRCTRRRWKWSRRRENIIRLAHVETGCGGVAIIRTSSASLLSLFW